MIKWVCPECGKERYSGEGVIVKLCYICQVDMQKVKEEVEDGES